MGQLSLVVVLNSSMLFVPVHKKEKG